MSDMPETGTAESRPAHLESRVVPARNGLVWYEEAIRLFKRAPAMWIALSLVTVAAELLLKAVPFGGMFLGEIVTPLVACGLVFAAAAADRRASLSFRFAFEAFGFPPSAIVAIIAASLVTFAAEAVAAWWFAEANLVTSDAAMAELAPATVMGIYAIGILASLPVTFVPFHVLLERVSPRAAFTASLLAFASNTPSLLVYAGAALVLLALSFVTMGLGLALAMPLWAASSYAAWKDIFDIREAPE